MKKLLLLCACLLALASPLQASPPEIVVVRIAEYGRQSVIIITRGQGKSEKMEFHQSATEFNEGYHKIFTKLYQEGYKLQGTFGTPMGTEGGNATLLFVKAS